MKTNLHTIIIACLLLSQAQVNILPKGLDTVDIRIGVTDMPVAIRGSELNYEGTSENSFSGEQCLSHCGAARCETPRTPPYRKSTSNR